MSDLFDIEKIEDLDTLKKHLRRSISLESNFENKKALKGQKKYEKHKETLEILIDESSRHKEMLQNLTDKIEGIGELEIEKVELAFEENDFLNTLFKIEVLMEKNYEKLLNQTSEQLIKDHWNNGSYKEFYTQIENIRNDEINHQNLLDDIIDEDLSKNIFIEDKVLKTKVKGIKLIERVEEELKDKLDFNAKRIIILEFDNENEYNKFSKEINDKRNIEIKEITYIGDNIKTEVIIRPETHRSF
ncbi:hypothetical protein C9439_05905 [archaeon SCG-AAA382B04]|nr:hypothetical protein C9439_05905 [archaeon SCG-AAA382B04]